MNITPAKKWAVTQIMYQDILDEIDAHFKILSIDYMPIKGAFLLCSGLADKMKARRISDIDILVHREDMERTSVYFAGLKNVELKVYYKNNYRPTETVFYYFNGTVKVLVEIHMLLNFQARFLLPTDELFRRSTTISGNRCLPSPEDSLLIFLCHIQSHMPFEFRNTYLEEIDLLISQEGFDWNAFWALSPSTGIEPFIYFILKLYQKYYQYKITYGKRYFYSDLLVTIISLPMVENMPRWVRRTFFDLPFVRRPVWLIFYKLFHRKNKK